MVKKFNTERRKAAQAVVPQEKVFGRNPFLLFDLEGKSGGK